MLFDIHSHILPAVDDGAENLNEALKILKLMQAEGITDVIATSHFYPSIHNIDDYKAITDKAYNQLLEFSVKRNLPRIYRGCELLFFKGLSRSDSLSFFCLNGSDYLLLELTDELITDSLFEEILYMKDNAKITPIIAHIERYFRARKYKKFIKFLKENKIPVQVNADSVLNPMFDKPIKKLFDEKLDIIIATDSHSIKERPPHLAEALEYIKVKYKAEYITKINDFSEKLRKEIIGGEALD